MFRVSKLSLLALLLSSICWATDNVAFPVEGNSVNQSVNGVYQLDICGLSGGLELPAGLETMSPKDILESTKYLTSGFRFNPNAPVYGLENKNQTCYAAALFQALKASPKFVSYINSAANEGGVLAGALKALFEAMDKPNAGLDDIVPQYEVVRFLRDSLKMGERVKVNFLEGVETKYYNRIANVMISIANEIDESYGFNNSMNIAYGPVDYQTAKEFITYQGRALIIGGGGESNFLFDNLWFALDVESKKTTNHGIFDDIAEVSFNLNSNGLFLSSEFSDDEVEACSPAPACNSSKTPSVLISQVNFDNYRDAANSFDVSKYRLVAIIVHHDRSLFSDKHLTSTVLGSDGNWYNTNNEFVFFVGPDLEIPPTTQLFVYELRN